MQITASAQSPIYNPYQPNTSATATPLLPESADSVSISAEAVQQAAALQQPGEKIDPGPTRFP